MGHKKTYDPRQKIANHAHSNYKIPYNDALELAKKMNLTNLKRAVKGGIKSFIHDHGTTIDIKTNSLEKRISGAIRDYYARLLLDRYLLNWLCTNRINLSEVKGELRNALLKLVKEDFHCD